jgi:hypothetical protein
LNCALFFVPRKHTPRNKVPLNFLNFLLVPPHLRVLPSIFGSVAWNTFLSLTMHRDHDDEDDNSNSGDHAEGGDGSTSARTSNNDVHQDLLLPPAHAAAQVEIR